mgnify:CR=1 FL=1
MRGQGVGVCSATRLTPCDHPAARIAGQSDAVAAVARQQLDVMGIALPGHKADMAAHDRDRARSGRDGEALCALPRELLNAGNSEIRNWICMAGATEHLEQQSLAYFPGYRTPAGTGTGLCFGVWS